MVETMGTIGKRTISELTKETTVPPTPFLKEIETTLFRGRLTTLIRDLRETIKFTETIETTEITKITKIPKTPETTEITTTKKITETKDLTPPASGTPKDNMLEIKEKTYS